MVGKYTEEEKGKGAAVTFQEEEEGVVEKEVGEEEIHGNEVNATGMPVNFGKGLRVTFQEEEVKGNADKEVVEEQIQGISKNWPKGYKVMLLIENDPASECLKHVEQSLMELQYEVMKCDDVSTVLSMLRDDGNKFDIVLCMDNAGGFKLLDRISKDVPVAMISNIGANEMNSDTNVIKCIRKGACDCLFSPVEKKDLRFLYKHTISNMVKRKRNNEEVTKEVVDCGGSLKKKARQNFTSERHSKFLAVVEQLGGYEKATPMKIFEKMDVQGLTLEQVASHFQMYKSKDARRLGKYIGESEDFRSGLIRPQLRGPADAPRLSNIPSHPILSVPVYQRIAPRDCLSSATRFPTPFGLQTSITPRLFVHPQPPCPPTSATGQPNSQERTHVQTQNNRGSSAARPQTTVLGQTIYVEQADDSTTTPVERTQNKPGDS